MNHFELHLLYKSETSFAHNPIMATAYFAKKTFDVVIDSDNLDPRILAKMEGVEDGQEREIVFIDPFYHNWLELKVIELIQENNLIKNLHKFKEDYEDAVNKIGQLEDQLYDAEEEIRDLKRVIE